MKTLLGTGKSLDAGAGDGKIPEKQLVVKFLAVDSEAALLRTCMNETIKNHHSTVDTVPAAIQGQNQGCFK